MDLHQFIYFCGSIRAGRQDVELYGRIIKLLKEYGTVLTEFIGDPSYGPKDGQLTGKRSDKEIHDTDVKLLKKAQVVVAEVTQPSLGVGYELGRAHIMEGKRILCLYRPQPGKVLSAMIRGMEDGKNIWVVDYKQEDLQQLFQDFFAGRPLKS